MIKIRRRTFVIEVFSGWSRFFRAFQKKIRISNLYFLDIMKGRPVSMFEDGRLSTFEWQDSNMKFMIEKGVYLRIARRKRSELNDV